MSKARFPRKSGAELNIGSGVLNCGSLGRAGDYAAFSEDAAKMHADAPVFETAVDGKKFGKFGSSGKESFRFSAIPGPESVMLMARVQKGRAQIAWLIDMSDPEFWSAMDAMTRTKQLGFAFRSGADAWFLPWEAGSGMGAFEQFRSEAKHPNSDFLDFASFLIGDGQVEKLAVSAFPDVEVAYRRVNILLTPQVEKAIKSIPGASLV